MSWVLFFDGGCAFCNRWVRRIARWDRRGLIHFAPLQGQLAARHALGGHLEGAHASLVLLQEESGTLLTQSAAVLQIGHLLGGPWRLLAAARCLPRSWCDRVYAWVARNRHRLAKPRTGVCELPDEHLASRLRD